MVIYLNQPRSLKQRILSEGRWAWPFVSSYGWQCVFIQDRQVDASQSKLNSGNYTTQRKAKSQAYTPTSVGLQDPR